MTVEMIAAMMARAQKDTSPGFSAPSTCPNYPGVMALLMTSGDALVSDLKPLPTPFDELKVSAAPGAVAIENSLPANAGRGPPNNLLS